MWRCLRTLATLAAVVTKVSGKPMENGQSLVGRDGVIIDCRTSHDSYFPDPDDCTMFYHCSDWAGLEHKSCGTLYFHPQKNVCDWPYIVRRVRHDCPDSDPAPFDVEDLTSSEEEAEAAKAFDDGGYVRFEPDPQVRFRFPTEPPAPPKSKLALKVIDDFQTTTSSTPRKTLKIRLPDQHPTSQLPRVPRGRRPTPPPLSTPPQHPITLIKQQKQPKAVNIKRRKNTNKLRLLKPDDDDDQDELIIKTLPSRDIVKSLPSKPRRPSPGREPVRQHPSPPVRKSIPIRSPPPTIIKKKKPTLSLNDRAPLRLAVTDDDDDLEPEEKLKIRLLLEQAKVGEGTTVLPEDIPISEESTTEALKTSTETLPSTTVPKTTVSPFKKVEERPDFSQVLKKKVQKFKEKLEEEAKKEAEEESFEIEVEDEEDEEGEELNVDTDEEIVEEEVEPFTTSTEESSTSTSTEGSRLKLTITKIVSTSEVLGNDDNEDDDEEEKIVITTEKSVSSSSSATSGVTTSGTETTKSLPRTTTDSGLRTGVKPPVPKSATTTTSTVPTETSTTLPTGSTIPESLPVEDESQEEEEDEEEEEKVLIIKPVQLSSNELLTGQRFLNDDDSEEDTPVHVVVAVSSPGPSSPNAQPLVSDDYISDEDSDEAIDDSGSNAVQESRIHTTLAEADSVSEVEGAIKREIATQSSVLSDNKVGDSTTEASGYDLVVNLLNHFDLDSVMSYLAGEEMDEVKKVAETLETTVKTSPTTTTATTTKTTTTTTTAKEVKVTTEPFATTERAPKGSDSIPATTTEDITSSITTTTSTTKKTENIQVVLPVGVTTTTSSYPKMKKKYVTIDRSTLRPLTTTEKPVAQPTRKEYVDIVRTTTLPPQEEEEETSGPTRKPYVVIDRSVSPPVITTTDSIDETSTEAATTSTTTAKGKREPKIVLVGGGTIKLDDDVEEDEEEEEEKEVEDKKQNSPFSYSKDHIRERFKSKSKSSRTSTLDVLKEINSKNFAKQREEARKDALRKAFGTNGKEVDRAEPEERVKAEDLGLDAGELAQRRKQLFSSRFRTSSNNQSPGSSKKVHPIEALKAKKAAAAKTTTTTTTPKPSPVKSLPLRLSSLPARRPSPLFLRRPNSSQSTVTSAPRDRRQNDEQSSQSSTEDKLKSLRCRLLRRPNC